jgi:hypothetical protein
LFSGVIFGIGAFSIYIFAQRLHSHNDAEDCLIHFVSNFEFITQIIYFILFQVIKKAEALIYTQLST